SARTVSVLALFVRCSYRSLPLRSSFPTRRSSDLLYLQSWMRYALQYHFEMLKQELILNNCMRHLSCPYSFLILSQPLQIVYHRRSEEHTSELQSRFDLVCRLLLEIEYNDIYS